MCLLSKDLSFVYFLYHTESKQSVDKCGKKGWLLKRETKNKAVLGKNEVSC